MNSRGDDSPDGELGDNILDVIAAWERKKIAERMNRGKRRKAKEGKVVAGAAPDYGFRYNESRDGYVVDGEKMTLIRRIFRMVGAEGASIGTVRRTLEKEGIPAPSGGRGWSRQYLRTRISDDVYLPHTFEEVSALVSPEVASSLDTSLNYGVWWYGKNRHSSTQRRDTAPDGTSRYTRARKSVPAPREDWIAVPVPDAGIPKKWVLAAREAIRDNEWSSNAGDRMWELTGGVIRCAECGRAMSVNHIRARGRAYYRCTGRYNGGVEHRCSMSHTVSAEYAEARVWELVHGVLTDPARLTLGLDRMLESERKLPDKSDEASWLRRISNIDRKQERLLNLHLEGDITTATFRTKSAELREAREGARKELETSRQARSRLEDIERSKEVLVAHYASLVPESLADLSSKEKNQIYKMMRLKVFAHRDDTLIADWGCNASSTPLGNYRIRGR